MKCQTACCRSRGPRRTRERDLDALLSGEAGYPAVVLGPVAGVLAALRAAPAPTNLTARRRRGRRSAFSCCLRPRRRRCARSGPASAGSGPVPPGSRGGQRSSGRARLDGRAPAGGAGRATACAGRGGAAPWHGRWQVMAAACGAAAAVIVGVAALAGAFSGPGGQQGRSGQRPSPQSRAAQAATARRHRYLARRPPRPTPRPTAVSPEALCRQFMDYFMHPAPPASRPAESDVVQQLSKLAGGQLRIIGYCARQLGGEPAHGYNPGFQGGPGDPAAGNQPGEGGLGEPGTPRFGRAGSAFPPAGDRSTSAGPFRAGRTAR